MGMIGNEYMRGTTQSKHFGDKLRKMKNDVKNNGFILPSECTSSLIC